VPRKPLAIVGLAGMFPGAPDVEAFWRHVMTAQPAPTVSLAPRWGRALSDDADPEEVPIVCDQGACLPDDCVDVTKGGDRQLVAGRHVVAAALKSAGPRAPDAVQTALVCGASWSGESYFDADARRSVFGETTARGIAPEEQLAQLAPTSVIGGPRLAVDAACASSLFALDVAAGLLESGLVRRVVVLGLNATLPAFMSAGFSQLGVLSPTGTTRPFARDAQGFVPGECAAAVVVEPLDRARAAGRPIEAVIRALGLSADGADRSVFAPSERGQRLAYERAYAELDGDEDRDRPVDYVEAHGTATNLGDAVELKTLARFLAPRLGPGALIPIGSVKSIVGHSLAAAGMVSVVKAVLMLRHGVIPPHLAVQPHPDLEGACLTLPTEAVPLLSPAGEPPRIGVSSFGFGGANAHVLLEGPASTDGGEPGERVGEGGAHPSLEDHDYWSAPPPLAITDFELALGSHLDVEQCQELLSQANPSWSAPDGIRFAHLSDRDRARLGQGSYFPAALAIEGAGLRMGPKFLARQDPLQLLLVELAHRMQQRGDQPSLADQIGTVVACNFGGQTSLAQARRWVARAKGLDGDAFAADNSADAIGPSLSSMCSGYVAYHFDLQGFHVTLAGLPGCFFTMLLLAPYWLALGRQRLLVGAARLIKSPLDVDTVADRKTRPQMEGEGAGVFALSFATASDREGQPLALVRAVVPGAVAADSQAACRLAQIDPDSVDLHDVCQLDPEHGAVEGSAQGQAGFLAEAAGIEALARAVTGSHRRAVIDVRSGERLVYTVIVDRYGTARDGRQPLTLPVDVTFGASGTSSLEHESAAPAALVREPSVESSHPLDSWLSASTQALSAFFATQRAALSLAPRAFGGAALGSRQVTSVVPRASTRARPGKLTPSPRPVRDVVLEGPEQIEGGGWQAGLLVDQGHPYFFDHPLDHIPGVLLVEGLEQLAERAAGDGSSYVQQLQIKFVRFLEKEDRVTLSLRPLAPRQFQVEVVQQKEVRARGSLHLASVGPAPSPRPDCAAGGQCRPDPSQLHKRDGRNVLVTTLRQVEPGRFATEALMPPSAHLLYRPEQRAWTTTYLIETARQALMLGGHGMLKIPQGVPMSIVSVAVELDSPPLCGEPLMLKSGAHSLYQLGELLFADVTLELQGARGSLGRVQLKSHVVDQQTYEEQRWKTR
jgi:3-oxoacyl-(acyl-carrier-protein) synthase